MNFELKDYSPESISALAKAAYEQGHDDALNAVAVYLIPAFKTAQEMMRNANAEIELLKSARTEVHVHVPENAIKVEVAQPKPMKRTVVRDRWGQISGIDESPMPEAE